MPGHRVDCYFCSKSILYRDVGLHLIQQHSDELFQGKNLDALHNDRYLTEPIRILLDKEYYLCLSDKSLIRHKETALKHFQGHETRHKGALYIVREEHPLKSKEKQLLEEIMTQIGHLVEIQKKIMMVIESKNTLA